MRFVGWLTFLPACLAAQTGVPVDPAYLLRDLRSAIQDDSLAAAAELAGKLDDAVQQRYSAWLIRDANQRIDEALAWLPADTESVWVNQQSFTIRPEQGIDMLWARPNEAYSVDRLAVLNDGEFYRALGNRKVRLVVAGARSIRGTALDSVPAPVAAQDVAYVFFFAEPIDFTAPDESIQGRPVWHAVAKIDAGGVPRPGEKRAQRDDENWLALARPEVGEPPFAAADLPHHPDGKAVGTTVRVDSAKQQMEVVYLSPAELLRRAGAADLLGREFQVDQPEAGVWRLISDVREKGPFPVHFVMVMLGFGMYR